MLKISNLTSFWNILTLPQTLSPTPSSLSANLVVWELTLLSILPGVEHCWSLPNIWWWIFWCKHRHEILSNVILFWPLPSTSSSLLVLRKHYLIIAVIIDLVSRSSCLFILLYFFDHQWHQSHHNFFLAPLMIGCAFLSVPFCAKGVYRKWSKGIAQELK